MPGKPRLLDAARRDRRHIRAWFRQPGAGASAKERLNSLEAAIASIPLAPYACPAGPLLGTRVLVSQKHRVVYRVMPDTAGIPGEVVVLRIYGPGQSTD